MKKQILALSIGLISVGAMAQKAELKAAEKAIKKGNFAAAATAIQSAEGLIANADDKYKSKFYFLKGQALAGKKDFQGAADAYNQLIAFDKKTGKDRYASKAQPMLNNLVTKVSDEATDLYNNKKQYKEAAEKFYLISKLSPKDTVFMYNAALSATQAKDYANAIKYYKELQGLGFTDVKTQYVATNKETGKVESFQSKSRRDLMVKAGQYIKPETKTSESKKVTIVKNMALLYKELGETDNAIKAFSEARAASPDDLNLILAEAYMYNDLGQPAKFEELMKEAISKDPKNPDLFFNIGIVNYNEKNGPEAVKYFTKALEINPDYKKGNLMLANAMLLEDGKLVEKMNSLPPSDMNGYTKLENERKALLNRIVPILEKADEQGRTVDTVGLLKGIYQLLENDAKAAEYKALEDSLKN